MSIQKKSLISTIKTAKKANVASTDVNAKPTNVTSKKMAPTSLKRKVASTRKMSHTSKISINFTKIEQ
jgi:hypothetical protein